MRFIAKSFESFLLSPTINNRNNQLKNKANRKTYPSGNKISDINELTFTETAGIKNNEKLSMLTTTVQRTYSGFL